MGLAPDYGLKLKSQGVPPDFEAAFHPFELFALAVNLHENLYTTTSNVDVEGLPHALTLDFDRETFDQTLALLPEEVSRRIRGDLKKTHPGRSSMNSQGLSDCRSGRGLERCSGMRKKAISHEGA